MADSYFIVLEGIDGCGKGTQINRLHNFLFDMDKSHAVLTSREPTRGKYGVEVRQLLKTDKDPETNAELMLELYTKDRKDHLETLAFPVMKRKSGEMKHFVLFDRYYYSTYAYQVAQGNPFEIVHSYQKQFPKPDVAIIFDLPTKVALERSNARNDGDKKFDKLEFMNKLRENYLKLPELLDDNIIIVDANRTREAIFEDVKKIVLDYMKK